MKTRHVLPGLRPEPLASYLTGLGLIRVVGEQADPDAAAAWAPDGLAVTTTVQDIAAWLAASYVPTPVLSPWNNGSGFGAKDKGNEDQDPRIRGAIMTSRTVIEAELVPLVGSLIQPTGFPDLGAAEFGNDQLLVESSGVKPAVSGGVKRDFVINEAAPGDTARGYGTVPHHRVEYTADKITAYFTIDRAQFRSYGLSEPATALLEALAEFEIATLLDRGLRLRTRCDLVVKEITRGTRPDAVDAAQRIAKLAADCTDELGEVTTVTWSGRAK